jgi:hypothetical protein
MVDKVKLNPMQFSKRSGGLSVPQSGSIPSLRNIPAVQDVGTESQAKAFMSLADDGTRLANMAGEQFERHIKEVEADQAIETEKVYARSLNVISEGINKIRETEGDINKIPDATLDFYNSSTSEVLKQSTSLSGYQRELLQKKYDNNRLNITNQALGYQAQLREMEQSTAVSDIVSATSSYIYNNPNQLNTRLAELKESFVAAGLNPVEAEAQIAKQRSAFAASAVQGLVAKNPSMALAKLNNGDYDGFVDGPTLDRLKRFADSNIKKSAVKKSADTLKAIAGFEAKINSDPLSVTDQDIVEAREAFGLSDSETKKMFRLRADAEIEGGVTEAMHERIVEAIKNPGDMPLNQYSKDDKDAVDSFYGEFIAPQVFSYVANGDTASASSIMADYISSTGIAPKGLVNDLTGRVRNGSPEQRKFAVEALDKIETKAPDVDLSIPAKDRAVVDVISRISKFEPDPEKALDKADAIMAMDEGMREGRIKAARKELEGINGADLVLEEFEPSYLDQGISVAWGGRLLPVPELDIRSGAAYRINETFQDAYKNYFVHNPDPEAAKEYAMKETKKRSGVSYMTGSPKLMQYAPESIMPPVMGSMGYLALDFQDNVMSLVPDGSSVDLVEINGITDKTASPETIKRRGRGPVYGVVVYDEYGIPSSLKDEDGDTVVYELPLPNKDIKDRYKQEVEKGFAEARKRASLTMDQRRREDMLKGAEGSIIGEVFD